MMAAREGRTEVVSVLLEAEANTDLQEKVEFQLIMRCGLENSIIPSHHRLTHTFLSPHSIDTLH